MAELTLPRPRRPDAVALLDWTERAVLGALFARMLVVNLPVILHGGHAFNVFLLASEGLTVLLLMVRRASRDVSLDRGDWLLAFLATLGPLLVLPTGGRPLIPPPLGMGLLAAGICLQLSAKIMLGRSFGIVPANRGIKVDGPYRFVRHPIYLGYLTVHVSFLLLAPNPVNLLIYGLSFSVQVVRILAEERLLARDPAYAGFMGRTRWRLLPGVF